MDRMAMLRHAGIIKEAARTDATQKRAELREAYDSRSRDEKIRQVKSSTVARALRQAGLQLSQFGDSEQQAIARALALELGIRDAQRLLLVLKEASNDQYFQLADYWSEFFSQIGS